MTDEQEVAQLDQDITDIKAHIKNLDAQKQALIEERLQIRAEIENEVEGKDIDFYEKWKEKYADIDLSELVLMGHATVIVENKLFTVKLKALNKTETLEIDKESKELLNETKVYGNNVIAMKILARSVLMYGHPDQPKSLPGSVEENIEVLGELPEEVIDVIWKEYQRMARWIQCAVRVELKNS